MKNLEKASLGKIVKSLVSGAKATKKTYKAVKSVQKAKKAAKNPNGFDSAFLKVFGLAGLGTTAAAMSQYDAQKKRYMAEGKRREALKKAQKPTPIKKPTVAKKK
jgi:hypothetical protein